jgi:peroxiredoxin
LSCFAVPGAFTPTCHLNHLPGYLENRDAILAKGVDDIAVISVNDAFVMAAWEKATNGAGKLRYLSDWDASFTKAIGMDMDLSAGTLGVRSKRYSMIVEDGKVTALNIEDARVRRSPPELRRCSSSSESLPSRDHSAALLRGAVLLL